MSRNDDEPDGGDPPCWAHLFDDGISHNECEEVGGSAKALAEPTNDEHRTVDLAALARLPASSATAWTHQSEDLNVNLLVFPTGAGVAEHVNTEVDVLLVGVAGEGIVDVEGQALSLKAGQALVVPKGTSRAIRAVASPFAYLSCHRRRAGLWPSA